jgi:dTDP-4-amino-4,6-dideoxygalactose transaminase
LGGVDANIGRVHVPVVSDACQALGIFRGDYTCCSFQAIKHITTGDGGMLICPTEETCKEAKLLRWFGIDRERGIEDTWASYRTRMMCFDIEVPGTKKHMNDIAAAMGIAGLKHYGEVLDHRRKCFNIYKRMVAGMDGIRIVDGVVNTCWLATFIVERRDDFAKKMFNMGIECNVVQVRNDVYSIFGGRQSDLPVMDSVEHKYLSLPLGMHTSEEDIEFICDVIRGGW